MRLVKTSQTAITIIPPEEMWPPIQAIRRVHDRHARRWMPHFTLIYPFLPRVFFSALEPRIGEVCSQLEPFEIRLAELGHFEHNPHSYTIWLVPEPADPFFRLQAALVAAFPQYDDTSLYPQGFIPHLSLGQARRNDVLEKLKEEARADWQPLSFVVRELSLIYRNARPDDIFRVDRTIPLGRR
ncbi:MAG: 2'-5' RNA ligase family protein [Phycisphaerae bacterium]|nr:2'-5' RNA ligase family protein [Phycisphaerae bacterium]